MSYFRSYFEKNNTIVKNTRVNTAKNPATEIFYGSSVSRFIFKVDFTELLRRINNGDYVVDENTTHTLHLTNTIFGDESFLGAMKGSGKQRATSFDLILFRIPEFWDEGVGFDYHDNEVDLTTGNNTFDKRPSNWYNRTTVDTWATPGVYSNTPTLINRIHFDNGNENLITDITQYVNEIISGENNYGMGIAFDVPWEGISQEIDKSVSFFTKYTQTFFEPFVETKFLDQIIDNRHEFTSGIPQNLYLYVTKGSNLHDLSSEPMVDILGHENTLISGLSDLSVVKVRKGIYKVTITVEQSNGKHFFYDKWKNLEVDGVSIEDITQKFIPKPIKTNIKIGELPVSFNRYTVGFWGIQKNEKILPGEKRRITVQFKNINESHPQIFYNAFYRIFVNEGTTEVVVHDWTLMDTMQENSFVLDTSIYVPREYTIQIKGIINSEEFYYKDNLKFQIISNR
jgi:hypothetical protein